MSPTQPAKSLRAVTYARQSREREDKSAASPEAQRSATLGALAARDWSHVDHFEDLGRSGWDPKVERPGLEAAIAAIESGRADVVVVYKLDRLTRQGIVEAVRLVERIQAAGGTLLSVQEPFFDLTNPMGLAIFGIFAAMAAQESFNISTRTRSAKAVLRDAGSHMSGRPPYGLKAVKVSEGGLTIRTLVVEPREADVVREVVARVLSGSSVVGLARELTARGLTTRPTAKRPGSTWTTSALGRLLRSPALAGYMPAHRDGRNAKPQRDARGRVLIARDADGAPIQPWEPVVDPADWHRLQDVLDARPAARGTSREPSLFGGTRLLRCAECGGPMVADRRPLVTSPDGIVSGGGAYRCAWHRSGKTRATCPGVSVSLVHAEDHVARAVIGRLAFLDPEDERDGTLLVEATDRFAARSTDPQAVAARDALEATIDAASAALERLDDDRSTGLFEGPTGDDRYARQVRALSARIADANSGISALPSPAFDVSVWLDPLASVNDPDTGPTGPGSAWDGFDVAQRREFLALFLDRVEVSKGAHSGGNTPFRAADRLRLVWAGAPDEPAALSGAQPGARGPRPEGAHCAPAGRPAAPGVATSRRP